MKTKHDLDPYQVYGKRYIKTKKRCCIWLDLGLGKTIVTLTAIEELFDSFDVLKVLVVAPKKVALNTWVDEPKEWQHTQHLAVQPVVGTKKQRERALTKDAHIYTINFESFTWLVNEYVDNWSFDMMVIDEACNIKDHTTNVFDAALRVMTKVKYLVELTATPSSNGYLDIWTQVFLVDGGRSLLRSFHQYRNKYFESDYMGHSWDLKPGAEETIKKKIKPFCMFMAAEDYSNKIPVKLHVHKVKFPKDLRQSYLKLERSFVLKVVKEGLNEDDETIHVDNAASLSNKLRQFCNGSVYNEDRYPIPLHSLKLNALARLIESYCSKPILLAYNYIFDKDTTLRYFPQAELLTDDPDVVKRWNAREIPLLIAHPKSAAYGLNLQHGGSTVIWYGITWSLRMFKQFVARLARRGQQADHVDVIAILVEDSIEDLLMLPKLQGRFANEAEFLEAFRVLIKQRGKEI